MKRLLIILAIVILVILLLYACSSTIRTAGTSFVTVTIGQSAGTATVHAENATPWLRLRRLVASVHLLSEAEAYIPSVVQVIVVTVSAPDMTTIVAVEDVSKKTATSITIEVPNGTDRTFTVSGIRGIDSQTYYRGTAKTDLTGMDVTLPIDMAFVGSGIWVSPTGSDTSGAGTQGNPYQTIGKALSMTTGTDAILVTAGTYTLTVGAAPATLQLMPATALICLGTSFSTVIDASATTDDLIYGNEGASIDNCRLIPGSDTTAIDDRIGGAQGNTPTRIKVNGVLVDADPTAGGALYGIMLSADSTVVETTVQNTTWYGINVLSGKPTVQGSTIAVNPIGIGLAAGAGDALVTSNSITNNATGIEIAATGKPTISDNMITNTFQNGTGIVVSGGNAVITNNSIRENSTGITVLDASPEIVKNTITGNWIGIDIATLSGGPKVNGNSIFCNAAYDVGTYDAGGTQVFDLRNNAWDHAAGTNPPGPIVGPFGYNGEDIVVSTPTLTPDYSGASAAPNGCLTYPIPVGKPAIR